MASISVRRIRFWFWVLKELTYKYRRALVFGIVIGFAATIIFWQVYPVLASKFFTPTTRIGLVGEYSPSNLPLSIQQQISYGLTHVDTDGTAVPALASSWESTESSKIWTFHLRSDVHWPNRKPVESGDINYNIRGVTLSAKDAHTLVASLRTGYSPLPVLMAKPIFQTGLRGFGPYKVDSIHLKGDSVDFLRLVPLEGIAKPVIEYRFYQTETQAILAYEHGDIDSLMDMSSPEDLAHWGKTLVTSETNYKRIVTIFFNMNNNLLKEKALRQALAYAVPKLDEQRAYSPISKSSWAYTTDKVRHYEWDTIQARKLFESTKIGSSSARLTLSTFPQYIDLAQKIASSWTDLGILTAVKVENSIGTNFEVLLSAQDLPPDPDQYPFWHSTQTQTNVTGYVNVKIDKLLEDGRQEEDVTKRKAIYADFQRRLTDDAPAIFLYYPKTYTITRGK